MAVRGEAKASLLAAIKPRPEWPKEQSMTRAIMDEIEAQLNDELDYQNQGQDQATDEQLQAYMAWANAFGMDKVIQWGQL